MRTRDIRIQVWINDAEKERLDRNVKKSGLSREAYLRSLINGYIPKELPPVDYHAMVKQIRAIGNRINQIAVKANTTGFIHANEYAMYADELRKTILKIQSALTQPEKMDGG